VVSGLENFGRVLERPQELIALRHTPSIAKTGGEEQARGKNLTLVVPGVKADALFMSRSRLFVG